jgi:hypothetical protein
VVYGVPFALVDYRLYLDLALSVGRGGKVNVDVVSADPAILLLAHTGTGIPTPALVGVPLFSTILSVELA